MSELQVIGWPIPAGAWRDHLSETEHFHDCMRREMAKLTLAEIKANRDALEIHVAHSPSQSGYRLLDIYKWTFLERSPQADNDDHPVEWLR